MIRLFLILICFLTAFGCSNNSAGIASRPDLIIDKIQLERLPNVIHDSQGRPLIIVGKGFDFTVTVANIGSSAFYGYVSIANTRTDTSYYAHSAFLGEGAIYLPASQKYDFHTSDWFDTTVVRVTFTIAIQTLPGDIHPPMQEESVTNNTKTIELPG